MTLTTAQLSLLDTLKTREQRGAGALEVRGARLRTAQALQERGLVSVGIGGAGAAFVGRWWYEATLTDEGRRA